MKGFLRLKLFLSLAVFVMIASAITVPFAENITHSHAQGPASIKPSPTHGPAATPPRVNSPVHSHVASGDPGGSILVPATVQWVSTGITLSAGDTLKVSATGSWSADPGDGFTGPDGYTQESADNFLNLQDIGACSFCATTQTPHWGALIGYIGDNPPAAGSYTSPSILPEAQKVFVVGSNFNNAVTRAGTLWLNFNDDAYSNFTVDNAGQVTATVTVTPGRQKLFVFIQGINSDLSANDATNNTIPTNTSSFGQPNGIYSFLLKTYPTAQFRMFSYNGAADTGTPQGYRCQDTFTQHLSVYVDRLKTQITNYLDHNANTDVYLIGHSMGGAVALGLLADLRIHGFLNINGGKIAGVVTLDSPLGGTPNTFHLASYYTKQFFIKSCTALQSMHLPLNSLDDLFAIFGTGTSTPHGGINSVALTLFGADFTNQEIATDAETNNSPVLTVGNEQDWIYDPQKCTTFPGAPDFASTEWVADQGNDSGVYGRVFSDGSPTCPGLGQIAINHFVVFTETPVQSALQQFVDSKTPSALAVAPNGP